MTGGASGLGEATVRALVTKGASVSVLDRQADRAEELLKALGPGLHFVEVDLTDAEAVAAAVKECAAKWGSIEGCAGRGFFRTEQL